MKILYLIKSYKVCTVLQKYSKISLKKVSNGLGHSKAVGAYTKEVPVGRALTYRSYRKFNPTLKKKILMCTLQMKPYL